MAKKSQATKGPAAPIQTIKGIGRLGLAENHLNPTVVHPKTPLKGGSLTSALLGRQGK